LSGAHDRITAYLANELKPSSNGLAIFSAGDELFEAIQVDAHLTEHAFFIGPVPHLYSLARLIDQYPRYAAVILDRNRARIFVVALGAVEKRKEVVGAKTRRTSMGGWSQARYQRHTENIHLTHIKEVGDMLDRIVRDDRIAQIVIAGDDVVVALLREHLPQYLLDKLVDAPAMTHETAESEIVLATLDAMRRKDAETDAEAVTTVVDAWQGNGLGVMGPEATLSALERGQVDELLLSANVRALKPVQTFPDSSPSEEFVSATSTPGVDEHRQRLASELVTRAEQTAARVRLIEDPALLEPYGGVGARLRFRL
jgi:peptide subunit release factor 1 (eRF1)